MAGTTQVTIREEAVPSSEGIGDNCALLTDEAHTSSDIIDDFSWEASRLGLLDWEELA